MQSPDPRVDFHPDRFYHVYASTSEEAACHRGQGPAGLYGAETSECDSPIALVNKTMEWIGQELRDKIDFVVWTGDSARHDNDEQIPRNAEQVVGLNEFMVHKMFEVFGKHNGDEEDDDPNNDYILPIVPNLGNNDILPHNVMTKGPNTWTRTYSRVWRQFIPEAQKHQFEQGGWFYVEVIPNKLAVVSLNTMYFFKSNAAVDGCAAPSEPGSLQLEWLRIQLRFMRERGMKAILTGHVPPIRQDAKTTWEETCWQKYTLWLGQYRDVVVSSLWGHFNYDHFMLQDFKDLDKDTKRGRMQYYQVTADGDDGGDELRQMVSNDYFIQLRNRWSKLPSPPKSSKSNELSDEKDPHDEQVLVQAPKPKKDKKIQRDKENDYLKKMGGEYAERFAAAFVGASVVPNLFPTLRVYEYNTTGLGQKYHGIDDILPPAHVQTPPADEESTLSKKKKKKHKKKKKPKKYKFKIPEPPSKSAPPGPAYSAQTLSLLKYTQYYANITHINNDFPSTLSSNDDDLSVTKWKEGKHKGKKPHDKGHAPQPKPFEFHVHYDTRDDDVYRLEDLTVPNVVDLARRIGRFEADAGASAVLRDERDGTDSGAGTERVKHGRDEKHDGKKNKKGRDHRKQNQAWYTFIRRAFVETMDPEEMEERFGH